MYLIAVLMLMKLYQERHPDVSCNAVKAYLGVCVALILEVVSYYANGPVFWGLFCVIYIIFVTVVTVHSYNLGVVRYDWRILYNVTRILFGELRKMY